MTTDTEFVTFCDARCLWAKGDDCDCKICHGKNHKRGDFLTPVQRAAVYTKAGRRVPTLFPGSFDWVSAQTAERFEQEGYTRRKIAAMMGVSPSTIRRWIRSLKTTDELIKAQNENQS